jgi:peptidoglycan-N-acetylglucosamine deacetylase
VLRILYQRVILVYDHLYRRFHGLDRATAKVGPAFRVAIIRSRWTVPLRDGQVVRPGDRICVLHLDNERIAELHVNGGPPNAIGLEFRRQLVASLEALAEATQPGGRLAEVRAFTATTIFHRGLRRLGFEVESGALACPRLTAAYQRALLVTLHPSGLLRLAGTTYARAERLWISREKLVAGAGVARSRSGAG